MDENDRVELLREAIREINKGNLVIYQGDIKERIIGKVFTYLGYGFNNLRIVYSGNDVDYYIGQSDLEIPIFVYDLDRNNLDNGMFISNAKKKCERYIDRVQPNKFYYIETNGQIYRLYSYNTNKREKSSFLNSVDIGKIVKTGFKLDFLNLLSAEHTNSVEIFENGIKSYLLKSYIEDNIINISDDFNKYLSEKLNLSFTNDRISHVLADCFIEKLELEKGSTDRKQDIDIIEDDVEDEEDSMEEDNEDIDLDNEKEKIKTLDDLMIDLNFINGEVNYCEIVGKDENNPYLIIKDKNWRTRLCKVLIYMSQNDIEGYTKLRSELFTVEGNDLIYGTVKKKPYDLKNGDTLYLPEIDPNSDYLCIKLILQILGYSTKSKLEMRIRLSSNKRIIWVI